jgi:tRNA threonylcarbamoyladenosine modification (KEOPS) complex  Pcc1 subunit
MTSTASWTATITVRRPSRDSADRLAAALSPEAAREVPRAVARVVRHDAKTVVLAVRATETGALRAAVNTYLGWIELATRTESVANGSP